jgi:hypothetical protein
MIYHTRREYINHYTIRPGLEPIIYHTRRGFKTWVCGVMVSVLLSSVIDHGFKTWSCFVMVSVLPSCVIDQGFKTWSCGVMVSVLPSSVHEGCTLNTTRLGLEPMIYHTRREYINHYTT